MNDYEQRYQVWIKAWGSVAEFQLKGLYIWLKVLAQLVLLRILMPTFWQAALLFFALFCLFCFLAAAIVIRMYRRRIFLGVRTACTPQSGHGRDFRKTFIKF